MSRAPEPTAPIDPDDLLAAPEHTTRTVRSRGVLSHQGHTLRLGTQWAGEPIRLTHAPGRLAPGPPDHRTPPHHHHPAAPHSLHQPHRPLPEVMRQHNPMSLVAGVSGKRARVMISS